MTIIIIIDVVIAVCILLASDPVTTKTIIFTKITRNHVPVDCQDQDQQICHRPKMKQYKLTNRRIVKYGRRGWSLVHSNNKCRCPLCSLLTHVGHIYWQTLAMTAVMLSCIITY